LYLDCYLEESEEESGESEENWKGMEEAEREGEMERERGGRVIRMNREWYCQEIYPVGFCED